MFNKYLIINFFILEDLIKYKKIIKISVKLFKKLYYIILINIYMIIYLKKF